jgi:regulatory protein RepA
MTNPNRSGAQPTMPHLNLSTLMSQEPPEPDYVLEGLPAGATGVVIAAGGVGKTFFGLQVGVERALGLPCFGGLVLPSRDLESPPVPSRVVYVMAEEPTDIIKQRTHAIIKRVLDTLSPGDEAARQALLALLAQNLHLHPLAGHGQMRIDDDIPGAWSLETLKRCCKGARLIILDPLRQFHAGDENSSWDMTRVVQRMQHLACHTGSAVLLTHHANKASAAAQGQDRANAARGSSALTDGVRWQLNLAPADDAVVTTFGLDSSEKPQLLRADYTKRNYGAVGLPMLLRRTEGGVLERVPAPSFDGVPVALAPRRARRRETTV